MKDLHGINTNLLVALEILLRERSVTRAARRFGVTQSAMSNILAQLRDLLGDPLLVRAGRGMEPTPIALDLAEDLRAGVEAFSRVVSGTHGFDPTTSTEELTLAMSDRLEAVLFPGLLAAIRERAPGLSLQVVPWSDLGAPPGLARDIDVAIGVVVGPDFDGGPLHHEVVLDEGLSTIVRRDHPRVRRRLTLKAFCELDHILVTDKRAATGIIDDALAKEGLSRRIAVRVPRHTLVGELVARTDLVATIDGRIARGFASSLGVRLFSPPVALPRGAFAMFWHDRTDADPARRWLRGQLREVAKES